MIKLYDIVTVRHEDYTHYGEVLSRLTPEDTFMVRMVPGHPGTLKEVSASKLMEINRSIRWVHYAEVAGAGSFPIDMLRYDFAAPLNFDPETMELDRSFGHDKPVIARASASRMPDWTDGRWSSFLWGVRHVTTERLERPAR